MSKSDFWSRARCERLAQLWVEGLPVGSIADALDSSKSAVCGKAHRLGLPKRRSPIGPDTRWSSEKDEAFRHAWEAGVPTAVIAAQFGLVRADSASTRAREMGLGRRLYARKPAKRAIAVPAPTAAARGLEPEPLEPADAGSTSACDCQWVMRLRPTLFCGQPVRRLGCAWCEAHHRRVYVRSSHHHERVDHG